MKGSFLFDKVSSGTYNKGCIPLKKNMGVINLTKPLKGKTGWVSIAKDNKRVIAQGKTLKELLSKLNRMGNPNGYIMVAAKDYSSYVG